MCRILLCPFFGKDIESVRKNMIITSTHPKEVGIPSLFDNGNSKEIDPDVPMTLRLDSSDEIAARAVVSGSVITVTNGGADERLIVQGVTPAGSCVELHPTRQQQYAGEHAGSGDGRRSRASILPCQL